MVVVVGADMEVEMVVEVETAIVKMMKVSKDMIPVMIMAVNLNVVTEVVKAKVKLATMMIMFEKKVTMVLEKMELMVKVKMEVAADDAKLNVEYMFSPHLNTKVVKMEHEKWVVLGDYPKNRMMKIVAVIEVKLVLMLLMMELV